MAVVSAAAPTSAEPPELPPTVRFANGQTLTWVAEAGAARYNVYKGILVAGSWQYEHDCLALDLTGTSLVDAVPPTPGHLSYYLVSQEDAAGDESPLGYEPGGATVPPGSPCTDIDGDAVSDGIDNCPDSPNLDQADFDRDMSGDACDLDDDDDGLVDTAEAALGTSPFDRDSDDDGLTDGDEVLLLGTDPLSGDTDRDGLTDELDNCRRTFNPTQDDGDADAVGNVCDNCPVIANPGQENTDRDQLGDVCEHRLARFVIGAGGGPGTASFPGIVRTVLGQSAAGEAVSAEGAILSSGFAPETP